MACSARLRVTAIGAALTVSACPGLLDESGRPCPCDEINYTCCAGSCVPFSTPPACVQSNDAGPVDAAFADTADAPAGDAGALDAPTAADQGGDVSPVPDVVSSDDTTAGCRPTPLSFFPTGIDPSDLDGCELADVTLSPAPWQDGGAAEGGDAGSSDGGDSNPADTVLDVDTGELSHAGMVLRPPSKQPAGGRDVQQGIAYRINGDNTAVITFGSLTIPEGAVLKVVGSRAVAIASATTIRIDGIIEARPMTQGGALCLLGTQSSPTTASAGAVAPGGYAGGLGGYNDHYRAYPAAPGSPLGPGPGGAGDTDIIGAGGGGGHAGMGGAGAASADAGGAGGVSYDTQPLDVGSFHGGSGGGGGAGGVFAYGGIGGSGGGAVRIVAATSIEIGEGAAYGGVNVSGCGGGPGVRGDGLSAPGGGGSGGALVIESPRVVLGARASLLAAGGGGGFFDDTGSAGTQGGSVAVGDTMPAAGCPWPDSRGAGGFQGADGVAGTAVPVGCAGGGATGWIRINAGRGGVAMSSGVIVAPQEAPWFQVGSITTD